MTKHIEKCWLVGDPTRLQDEMAPLDCLHCKRDIPYEYDSNFLDKETYAFVSGYRFAMHNIILHVLSQDLNEEETCQMLDGMGKRLTCSIDRGTRYEDFMCAFNNIMALMREKDVTSMVKTLGVRILWRGRKGGEIT